jgi:hypothetical protein
MPKKEKHTHIANLPKSASDFINLIIKKMRYRKKVRADVHAELAAHFEDELKDCKTDQEKEQKARQLIADFGDPKLLAVLLRRAKKRCRPLWRTIAARTFQTASLLFICLVAYVVWFFSGRPAVTVDYVAQLNRIARPPAQDSLNAQTHYEKALTLYVDYDNYNQINLIKTPYRTWLEDLEPNERQAIENWVADNHKAIDRFVVGSKEKYYWQQYEYGTQTALVASPLQYLPSDSSLVHFRDLTHALCWRARLRASRGQFRPAFDDIIVCYRAGKGIKGAKIFTEQVLAGAIQSAAIRTAKLILANHRVDSETLSDLQRQIEQIVAEEDFAISPEAEKLFMYDEIQRCFTDDRLTNGHLSWQGLQRLAEAKHEQALQLLLKETWTAPFYVLFAHPNKHQTRKMVDEYYNLYNEVIEKSPVQLRVEGIDLEKQVQDIIGQNLVLKNIEPLLHRVHAIGYRNKVDVEAFITIIALQRFKNDKASYPKTLNELTAAGYLKQLPIDPFSDKPLVYKRTDDGFLLYSFGRNLKDDGGRAGDKQWDVEGDTIFWPVRK